MITLVEALNYRCLRYVQVPLEPFHVLVGPNASGKTTFLDVIGFLSDLVSHGLERAFTRRTPNSHDMLFGGEGHGFELAVEAKIPDELRNLKSRSDFETVRYQVSIGLDDDKRQFEIKAETLLFKNPSKRKPEQRSIFPVSPRVPETLQISIRSSSNKVIINKVPDGNDNFYSEIYRKSGKGWAPSFRLGTKKSALGNLIDDPSSFPIATWFRNYLTDGLQRFVLNSLRIRRPSPPAWAPGFLLDGSNLPWVVFRLKKENPTKYKHWINHLKTSLPDLVGIDTIKRPEDNHRYMRYKYRNGHKVPSWLVSDGTLRLTALTLPAYLADFRGIYLIEEPENGIHPKAVSTVYDSLSSMYDSQVLLATHSPVILNMVTVEDVLCFAKDEAGATDIVRGDEHPHLQEWNRKVALGTLLASGVLG